MSNQYPGGTLNIVIALMPEAKPVIDHFKLLQTDDNNVFTDKDDTIRLIVSGIGKNSSYSSVNRLAQQMETNKSTAWLNVGIAGHRHFEITTPFIAHKITDNETGKSWYPPQILDLPFSSALVTTVDKEVKDYPQNGIYEMEASGFYEAASKYTTHELIHCIKIVSDNEKSPTENVTKQLTNNLITNNLKNIEPAVQQLLELSTLESKRLADPPYYNEFLSNWHISVTQQHQLKRLLQRWSVLFPEEPPFKINEKGQIPGRVMLANLKEKLNDSFSRQGRGNH